MLNIPIISFVILLGLLQAIVLSGILFFSKRNNPIKQYFLAWLILIFAYNSFEILMFTLGKSSSFFFIDNYIPLVHIYCLGTLLFLYIVANTIGIEVLSRPKWFYFFPALLCLVVNLSFVLLIHFTASDESERSQLFTIYRGVIDVERHLMIVVFAWFLFQSYKTLQLWYRDISLMDDVKEEKSIIHRWLTLLLYVFLGTLIIWAFTIYGSVLLHQESNMLFYLPLECWLSFVMYWIAFMGFHRISIIRIDKQKNNQSILDLLGEKQVNEAIEQLKKVMEEEQCYLNPELNLAKVSELTGLNPKIISAICNQILHKGFGEFINEYRIEEAKHRLSNPQNNHLTILSIAYDAGFNSLPTFQRSFKQVTGMTPTAFQKKFQE
jgi:AraC-like DNA-binding protein